MGFFFVFFAWIVFAGMTWRLWLRPRVVPYFSRELGKYGGPTTLAFRRGRGLYRDMAALDRRAAALGVTPLSAFGFAYDYYEQEVRWHRAADGLQTAEALGQGRVGQAPLADDVAADLEALAAVLRVAAEQRVDFSLTLRLYKKDDLQALSYEARQGTFW